MSEVREEGRRANVAAQEPVTRRQVVQKQRGRRSGMCEMGRERVREKVWQAQWTVVVMVGSDMVCEMV